MLVMVVSALWWEWWWWLPPPGGLPVTVLTLVTFLEWNDLNKVKDDGKKHWMREMEGGGLGKSVVIELCSWLTFVSSHNSVLDSYLLSQCWHWCRHTSATISPPVCHSLLSATDPPFSSIQVSSLTRRILILKSHNFTKPAPSTLLLLIHFFLHQHLPP